MDCHNARGPATDRTRGAPAGANEALDALNIYGEQSEGCEKIAAAVEERGEREVRGRFAEMYSKK
jgi:hypothetical protein